MRAHDAPVQPVGYAFFIGLLYKLFGSHYSIIIFVQILLCIIAGWLLFCIAQRLFNIQVASLTVLLASFNVGLLTFTQFILAEIMLVVLLLAFWERFTAFLQTRNTKALVVSGVFLGLSNLIKPMTLFFPVIVGLFVLLYVGTPIIKKVGIVIMFLIACYTPIFGYMVRNYVQHNVFAFAPMMELNMYNVFLSKVIAQVDNKPVEQVAREQLAFTGTHALDPHGWDNARVLFFTYLKKYPHMFAYVWFKNVIKTVFGLFTTQLKILFAPHIKGGGSSFFKQSGTLFTRIFGYLSHGTSSLLLILIGLLEMLWLFIEYLTACYALANLHAQKKMIYLLFLIFIVQSACMTGIDGCGRYRVAFEPLLLLLSAYGLYTLWHTIKNKKVHIVV